MLRSKDLVCSLTLWIFINTIKCQDLKEMSETLDQLLSNSRSFRRPRDHEDTSVIWQEYEFDTKAGNREEVVVTNISLYTLNVTEEIDISADNCQFLQTDTSYCICAKNSTLVFYKINLDNLLIESIISIEIEGYLSRFKILYPNIEETFNENLTNNVTVMLLVEYQFDYFIYCYNILENTYNLYLKLPVRKQIQDIEFVQEENEYKLLLFDNNNAYFEEQSLIDIYGFNIDYNKHRIDIWFCRRLLVPKALNIQVCSIYDRTVLAFQRIDNVLLYQSKKENKLCQFEEMQIIQSNKLANFICFESGYIKYLAVGSEKLHLFHFFENFFEINVETDLHFNETVKISWIVTVPLNTYRDESLLLVQFNNSTVTALVWHGSKFKVVSLPNQILNNFDLSKIVIIPKVGFIYINTLVRIEVILNELEHPIYQEAESVLKTRALLEEVFRKQEAIFDETEARFNQSYFTNHITTGFWNFSEVNVSNVTIKENINYGAVKMGSANLTIKDLSTNITSNLKKLEELETKLDKILLELKNTSNLTEIILPSNIEINGDFLVNNTLYVKNITVDFINNVSTSTQTNNIENFIIDGQKSFPLIDVNNLTIFFLNGIPVEEFVFDLSIKNYSNVDFSKLKRLQINGHLNFFEINNIKWNMLMQNIVWKDKETFIPGKTIIEKLVAEEGHVTTLNNLLCSKDYVLTNNKISNILSEKYFANLSTQKLYDVKTINKIDVNDFIILNRDEVINEEIIFDDLEIGGLLQIDGIVTGINISGIENLLNETNSLSSYIIFENLNVMGNIIFNNSINSNGWSDFDNFLLKTEKNAEIIGNKIFQNNVNVKSHVTITSGLINNHHFSHFVTLNTNQEFSNLKKISANVTFGNVTFGYINKLENYIISEQNITSGCLNKILFFFKSFIVDNLSFNTIKHTITQSAFFDKVNKTFQKLHLENLTISTLITDNCLPNTINGVNYKDLAERVLTSSTQQNLTNTLIIDNLETDILDVKFINEIPINTWNLLKAQTKSLLEKIFYEKAPIRSLRVEGKITASSINNNDIIDIYKKDTMKTVIFNKNVSIESLKVIGFVNNLNFSQFVADAVWKDDKNITFINHKTFKNVSCEFLETQFVNEHLVSNILDPNKNQILKGPIVVKGLVMVSKTFNTTGKIGNSVFLSDFANRYQTLENNSYVIHGNVYFTENVFIRKLNVNGSVQGSILDNFMETIIFKNDTNFTVSGAKLFKNLVTFNGTFNIDRNLNDLDLQIFYKNVIYVDKPFSINTKLIFHKDVYLQKNLIVKTQLQSDSIMGVDMKDLKENAIALDKPKYFSTRMKFDNVTFEANIKVTEVNDLQIDLLILLNTPQFLTVDVLNCTNVTVQNIEISGHINTYYLKDIYENTFMIYGNQEITGHIKMWKNVYVHHDFNANLINNFDPAKIISLTTNDTLIGNFMFKTPIVFDKNLRILGLLNNINITDWQEMAIKTTDKAKQIISGKWKVHGNVYFEKNVNGNKFINEVNITDMSLAWAKKYPILENILENTEEDLNKLCALQLNIYKCNALNQIYKFNTFDYLTIQKFEGDIHDIRHVEINDVDYILVNYHICHVKLLLYTQNDFQVIDEVSDFGLIDQWTVFELNHILYLFTISKRNCGRSLNNIWKLENNRLIHVLELNNVMDTNLHQDEFVAMIRKKFEVTSGDLQTDTLTDSILHKNKTSNVTLNRDIIALTNQSLIYKNLWQEKFSTDNHLKNCVDCDNSFKMDIYEKDIYIYYDKEISSDYIYLCKNDTSQTRILQTIKTHQPKLFLILNFSGFIETLFIFVENNDTIRIYEYAGVKGFVYRNTIQMKVDKLYNFKIRKYNHFEKRHCLAVVYKNKLTILEAKMYGERLDIKTFALDSCYTYECNLY